MKKQFALIPALALTVSLLAGCAGKPAAVAPAATAPTETTQPEASVPVKTGLYIGTDISGSTDGQAKFDVTLVAVTVTDDGVIDSCVIDSIPASAAFDEKGTITSDISGEVLTKNELGEDYGMKAYAGSAYEWNEQAAALAQYAVGKTVEQLKNGAVDETGYAADPDLATSATIHLGGYVEGIEAAVNAAVHLGARSGDRLSLAAVTTLDGEDAGETDGFVRLNSDITAMTMDDGMITACCIDSLQAKIAMDASGKIVTDLTAPILTKNALGEDYGMKLHGGAAREWNEQAAAFAAYVTGKTPEEVAGIAVNEKTAPAEADLAASVTISIGGFQELIARAAALAENGESR